jgi:hypothetical protein
LSVKNISATVRVETTKRKWCQKPKPERPSPPPSHGGDWEGKDTIGYASRDGTDGSTVPLTAYFGLFIQ